MKTYDEKVTPLKVVLTALGFAAFFAELWLISAMFGGAL